MLLADHKRFSVYVRTDLNDRRFFGKLECFFYVVEDFVFLLVFPTLFFSNRCIDEKLLLEDLSCLRRLHH